MSGWVLVCYDYLNEPFYETKEDKLAVCLVFGLVTFC